MHHRIGDMPGSELLVRLVADLVVRSRDLATAIGVDQAWMTSSSSSPACSMRQECRNEVLYAYGWFKPLPEGATPLERLIHLVGR